MPAKVKICGITEEKSLKTAINENADFIGFVFFEKSPRNISIEEASKLIKLMPDNIKSVALTVNETKENIEKIITETNVDYIQLHGSETIDTIKWIKDNFTVKIIKAIPIANKEDLEQIKIYQNICDFILLDAKPMENELPGGNGLKFDWNLIKTLKLNTQWMLAGGLNPDNVSSAIQLTQPNVVDVSSGVESSAGIKNNNKIIRFIKNSRNNLNVH